MIYLPNSKTILLLWTFCDNEKFITYNLKVLRKSSTEISFLLPD